MSHAGHGTPWILWVLIGALGHLSGLQAQDASPTRVSTDSVEVQQNLVLDNVTVIDGTGAPPRARQSLVLADGVIADVYETGTREAPEGATVRDLSGRHVVPGLINGHVHLNAYRGDTVALLRTILHQGVTTVRDLGGDARILAELARDARSGAIESPTIHFAANLFGPPFAQDPRVRFSSMGLEPGSAPWAHIVTAETDLPQVVTAARETGATGLKLYASLEPHLVRRITEEAHRQGLRVWAHATTFPGTPSEIVAAGVDGVEHTFLLLPEGAENTPESYATGFRDWLPTLVPVAGEATAEPYASLYAAMAEGRVLLGTTLHVAHRLARVDEELEPGWQPPVWAALEAWECAAIQAAHAAGVGLVAGTDLDGSVPIQTELELLVGCGLSPIEAITSATLRGAQALGIEGTHGTIEPGKAADLVVLGSDPLADIQNTRDVALVIKAGRWVEVGSNG